MKIVLATRNRKKLEELKRLMRDMDVELLSLEDFPQIGEVIEDGRTFEENAIKKALEIAKATGLPAIADDSGLVVKSLGGSPGIYSARYGGEPPDDRKNIERLLREMAEVPDDKRQAHFICVIAFATPEGEVKTFTGRVDGIITKEPKGEGGFGYDPVFEPEGLGRTFAEMSDQEKDTISHRMRAIKLLKEYLQAWSKKLIFLILYLLVSLGSVYAFSEKGNCKACHRLTVSEAQELLKGGPELKVTEVVDSPIQGLWEVVFESQGKRGILYIDYTKRFIIAGNIFSTSTKENLTYQRLSYLNRVDPSKISLEDALVLGDRKAKYKVIVFDDPDCPYCARLHQEMKKIVQMRKDIVFYIKLYPLEIHPQAYEKSKIIVCERSLKLLEDAFNKKEIKGKSCDTDAIDKNIKLAKSLGISGTPAYVLPDGRVLTGYRPADELIKIITRE